MGVVVVEARGHVLPVVPQRGGQLLLGGDRHQGVLRDQLEQLAKAVHRQHVGHVRALRLLALGRDLGQLTVLGSELGRRSDLHPLGLLERALREGREPGQALDLDVEQLAANGSFLGGRIDVENVAADGELAAVLHLLHALVAAGHQPARHLVEVEQPALLDLEAVGPQRRVGELLGQSHRARDEHRRRLAEERIESGHTQAHQMGRRREMRLVAHAARRIEAHRTRAEKGLQVGGQVASRAIVARHHQRRALGVGVDQRGEQVRAHARGHEHPLGRGARVPRQSGDRVVVLCVCEEASEHAAQPPGGAARPAPILGTSTCEVSAPNGVVASGERDRGQRPDQALRPRHGGRRRQLRGSARRGHGLPRPQRRRQDHHPAHDPRARPSHQRHGHRGGQALRGARRAHADGRRRSRALGLPSGPAGARPPPHGRPGGPPARVASGRGARGGGPHRCRRPPRRPVLAGHAPAAVAGHGAAGRAPHPDPRRARQRPGPPGHPLAARLPALVRRAGTNGAGVEPRAGRDVPDGRRGDRHRPRQGGGPGACWRRSWPVRREARSWCAAPARSGSATRCAERA